MVKISLVELEQVLPIRQHVLWPDLPIESSLVEGDNGAIHIGASVGNKLVCVASIFIDGNQGRLRKFATLPDYQGQGIGSQVIEFVLNMLERQNIEVFWCDARESALDFYKRFGMVIEGDIFYKKGVAYKKASLVLSTLRYE
ncbi:GNAT family N-acetyltransferase [Vibrio mediterranei]|uniref:GNAT family N-acetyltransferase n=1 Tax=Vibrio mediterranei TaxID=689 RepID=A0ABX5D999_9VIBR|nr:GNAT family N-acetyltransferase [Vibrio mediterranei]PCD86975.1 GNAT family N-acetyltransferase [Vibrio mediterranei]PRQ66253.1 GNAT family N-acetyltransferase [Vibrio mediterranei]